MGTWEVNNNYSLCFEVCLKISIKHLINSITCEGSEPEVSFVIEKTERLVSARKVLAI